MTAPLGKVNPTESPGPEARNTSLRRPKLADLVAADLRYQIVNGLEPGAAIANMTDLCRSYDVSLPTARQALKVLEAEGLLVIRRGANGGAVARHPDIDNLARSVGLAMQLRGVTTGDLYAARASIEVSATRQLASVATAECLSDLDLHLDRYDAAISSGSIERAVDEHSRFHDLILSACPNKAMGILGDLTRSIVDAHSDLSVETMAAADATWIEHGRRAWDAHRDVIAAIRGREVERAETRIATHLERWLELVPLDEPLAVVERPTLHSMPPPVSSRTNPS
jgi:DNA-binding FadR family transcriptional regulator